MENEVPKFIPLSTADAAIQAREKHRLLILDIAKWSLANGRGIDLDKVAIIIDSRLEYGDNVSPFYWTRTSVYSHLWATVCNYLSFRRALIPEDIGETMWIFLDYLVETNQIDLQSDPIEALREPLHCYWWLDQNGIARTDDGPRYGPCRCRDEYSSDDR